MDKRVLNNYVQAFVPDKEDLAVLVSMAKGPDRSMAEFSRVCKVKGPSTFSRIVNELIDKPVSDELLFAIAKNAYDSNEVTLDMLMRANGKIPKEEMAGGGPTSDNRKLFRTQSEKIKIIKDILVQHYLNNGHSVMIHPDIKFSEKVPKSKYGLAIPSDFSIHVQGIDPLFWNFIVDFTDLNGVSLKSAKFDAGKLMAESIKRYSSLFLRDAWEPESLKDFKNTIIFTEEKAFAVFRILMMDAKCNSCISAMYIDDSEQYIENEFYLNH